MHKSRRCFSNYLIDIPLRPIILITLFLILACELACAKNVEPLLLTKGTTSVRLEGKQLDILEDSAHVLTIQDFISGTASQRFKTFDINNPNFRFSTSAFWATFEVYNQDNTQNDYLLEIAAPLLDSISFFYLQDGQWHEIKTGDAYKFSQRPIKNRHFLFQMPLPPHTKRTFYVRVSSQNGLIQFPMRIWNNLAFEQYNHQTQFAFGIIYGIIIFILINNLFLYFSLGGRNSYLFYVMAMASSLVVIATFNGHSYEYIWRNFPLVQRKALPMSLTFLDFWLVLFCRRFLDTHTMLSKFDKALKVFGFVQFGFFVLAALLPYRYAMWLANISATATASVLMVTGITAIIRKNQSAWFFISGFSIYILGYVVFALKSGSILPTNAFTEYSIQVGAALQVILLSFALGVRIREIRHEKEQAQKAILEAQMQYSNELESKVTERTAELNEKAEALENSYRTVSILSSIGQEITASLDHEAIFEVLYRYVHDLMDASFFGVDLYDAERREIIYAYNIEKGVRLPEQRISAANPNNLSAYIVRKGEAIFMNNIDEELPKILPKAEVIVGQKPLSIIAMPLLLGERPLGVVSVQSFERNAYSSQHFEIMKTLASYTAIALDNATSYMTIKSESTKTLQSIRYARRIQESLLPRPRQLEEHFDDACAFYRPRDIVSGDFYWFETLNKEDFDDEQHLNMPTHLKMLAVADCTGHGVPGALMTIMGTNLLNQIISERGMWQPDEILERLDERVKYTFHLEDPHNRRNDGMDIGICAIDKENQLIYYAGAKMPLYIARKGIIETIKASPFAIGGSFISRKRKKEYRLHILKYQKGDNLFLASDGFQDQFGGEGTTERKYYTRFFRQLLEQISSLSTAEQYSKLTNELVQWKRGRKQTDDILVISVKL